MDLENYWQENRKFVLTVAGGALVFLIAFLYVDSAFGDARRTAARRLGQVQNDLKEPRFNNNDKSLAERENEALLAATDTLKQAVAFESRPEFTLRPNMGSENSQYMGRIARMQNELAVQASRARVVLPEGLDIEPLKTSDTTLIERHLQGLDLLSRLVALSIEAGVDRVVSCKIELDSGLSSRDGVGAIERTRVQVRLTSDPPAAGRFMALTQSDRFGKPLVVDTYDVQRAAGNRDEVKIDATFLVVRLHEVTEEEN
tara:strand:+ start:2344 stop:3117 length:774 start_codon:yes stop_codon:yes gene_type:complete